MPQYDITIASSKTTPSFTARSFMLADGAVMQDITPASTRRSDGDARYSLIQTESFWGQNDFSAGVSLEYPPDPSSFRSGPVDSLQLNKVRPAFATSDVTGGNKWDMYLSCRHGTTYWACVFSFAAINVYEVDTATGTWTYRVTLPQIPVAMVSFRNKLWFSYGNLLAVQTWDGTTLATLSFNAFQMTPYGSMLSFIRYDGSKLTYCLNRYDPENPTTFIDVGIFPFGNNSGVVIRSLCALSADLYIVCNNQLWRFTSANGNSGILSGPVDTWKAFGSARIDRIAGKASIAFQGALYYSTGTSLRRYQPGGTARVIYPVPGRVPDIYVAGANDTIDCLASAHDRLYMSTSPSIFIGGGIITHLLAVLPSGIHHVADCDVRYSIFPGTYDSLVFQAHDGRLIFGLTAGANYTTPYSHLRMVSPGDDLGARELTSTLRLSRQDFGMADIPKAVSRIGLAAICPAGTSVAVSVSVDGGSSVAWGPDGLSPASTVFPSLQYFIPPTDKVVVGKMFVFTITLTGASSTVYPELWAVQCIPNPINPLRRGGRFTIRVSDAVMDHDGGKVYAAQTDVDSALAFVRALRVEQHPLTLTWQDGATYNVRFNTQTIRRVISTAGRNPHWAVDIDWQEIS